MRETIERKLEEIEQTEKVTILFAVEAGSRAYGLHTATSDYDVRFVYVRPRDAYLKLTAPRDVLEYPISDDLDICGWDLPKALRLLKSSNRSLFEWCESPVVYRDGAAFDAFKALAEGYFSAGKNLRQQLSAAEADRNRLVKEPTAKQYLAFFRDYLSFCWVLKTGARPPALFDTLLEIQEDPRLRSLAALLADIKCMRTDAHRLPPREELDAVVETAITRMKQTVSAVPVHENPDWEPLDAFFLKILDQTE